MIIRKAGTRHAFTIIDRTAFEDDRLSAEAKGIYGYCIVKPDNWRISMTDIRKRCKVGRDKLQKVFTELQKYGYAELVHHYDKSKGRASGSEWIIYEVPSLVSRQPENPVVSTDNLKNRQPEIQTACISDSLKTRLHTKQEEELSIQQEVNTKGETRPAPAQKNIDPYDEESFLAFLKSPSNETIIQRLKATSKGKFDLGPVVQNFRLYLVEQAEKFQTTGNGLSPAAMTPAMITARLQRWVNDQQNFQRTYTK